MWIMLILYWEITVDRLTHLIINEYTKGRISNEDDGYASMHIAEHIKWVTKVWGQAEESSVRENFAVPPAESVTPNEGDVTLLYRVHDAANNCEDQLFEGDDLGELMTMYRWHEAMGMTVTRDPVLGDIEWYELTNRKFTANPEHYTEEE